MSTLILALLLSVPPFPAISPASFAVPRSLTVPAPPKNLMVSWTRPNDEKAMSVSLFETQDLRKDWNFVTNVSVVVTNVIIPNQYSQEFFKLVSVNNVNLDSDGIVEQLNN